MLFNARIMRLRVSSKRLFDSAFEVAVRNATVERFFALPGSIRGRFGMGASGWASLSSGAGCCGGKGSGVLVLGVDGCFLGGVDLAGGAAGHLARFWGGDGDGAGAGDDDDDGEEDCGVGDDARRLIPA